MLEVLLIHDDRPGVLYDGSVLLGDNKRVTICAWQGNSFKLNEMMDAFAQAQDENVGIVGNMCAIRMQAKE